MLQKVIAIKSILWTAAKYLLAGFVLGYVIYANWGSADGRGLGDVWRLHVVEREPIREGYLLVALAVHALGMAATLYRWYILVRAQDLPFTVKSAFRLGMLGYLFNAFLPGAVGGDFIKAAALAREQDRRTVAIATVIMDRFMSLWGLILLLAVVGSVCWYVGMLDRTSLAPARVVIGASVVIIAVSVAVWFAMALCSSERADGLASRLSHVPAVGGSLSQLWEAAWLYRNRPVNMLVAVALSTVSNVCDVVAFYCYAHTLWDGLASNPLPSLGEHFLLVPVGLVISAVPLFPGGAGIGEAGFGGLYEFFNSAPANGVLGSLFFRVSGWIIGVLGYLLCSFIDTTPKQSLQVDRMEEK